MTPIPLDIDDVLITLKSIERNKVYDCHCVGYQPACPLKQKLSFNPSQNQLVATEALLNVRNASTEAFQIDVSGWELVDADGFAYRALAICDALRPLGSIDLNSHGHVSPGTQVNVVLLFSELKSDTQISCLSYSLSHRRHHELHLFE